MKIIEVENIKELKTLLSKNSSEPIVINLKNDVYEIEEGININHNNITINGNGSVLKGSRRIDFCNCEIENGIVKIDLKQSGIPVGEFGLGTSWGLDCFSNYDQLIDDYTVKIKPNAFGTAMYPSSWSAKKHGPGLEVFFDGEPMKLTRYPESGFMHIKHSFQLPDPSNYDKKVGDFFAEDNGKIIPDDEEFTRFKLADRALLVGNWMFDWATQKHEIDWIDSNKNMIKIKPPFHGYGYNVGATFYALNVFEMLKKQIGCWFIDRKDGFLYIHPFDGQNYVDISICDNMFYGKNLADLKFGDISVAQCRFSAYSFKNSNNISVKSGKIKNMGDYAIVGINCIGFSVENCKIESTGGGITLHGGDNENLISGNNLIKGNEITKIGRWQSVYMPAVDITGVGTKVSGNYIHDIPHIAILFGGNYHIIEKNEISHFCTETNDAAAIYCGRNLSYYGNEINNNFIHDSQGLNGNGIMGLYFDDFSASVSCCDNVIENVTNAVMLGGGHDFVFKRNIFSNCDFFSIDSRGKEWSDIGQPTIQDVLNKLRNSPYKNKNWGKAFPKLCNADIESEKFLLPYGNEIAENTFINCGGIFYQHQYHDEHFIKIHDNTFINQKTLNNRTYFNVLDWVTRVFSAIFKNTN